MVSINRTPGHVRHFERGIRDGFRTACVTWLYNIPHSLLTSNTNETLKGLAERAALSQVYAFRMCALSQCMQFLLFQYNGQDFIRSRATRNILSS